jgi:hypothetical protein
MGFDPRTQAIFGMAVALATVEGKKVSAVLRRKREQRQADTVARAAADMAGGGTIVQVDPNERGAQAMAGTWPRPVN